MGDLILRRIEGGNVYGDPFPTSGRLGPMNGEIRHDAGRLDCREAGRRMQCAS
jgi:hypothetical protein